MIFKCLKIDPNYYIKKFEYRIEPFLTANGYVDGRFLKQAIMVWKPQLKDYVEIPDDDFRLSELIDIATKLLLGRKQ